MKLTIVISDSADARTNWAAEFYGKSPENTRVTTVLADASAFLNEGKNVVMVATHEEAGGLEEMAKIHVNPSEHEIVLRDIDA